MCTSASEAIVPKFRQDVDFIEGSDQNQWSDGTFGEAKRLLLMILVFDRNLSDYIVFSFVDAVNHPILVCVGDDGFTFKEQDDVSFGWLFLRVEPFFLGH